MSISKLQPWIDTRLGKEEMDFLHNAISEENKENMNHNLAGHISKSEMIKDKDNWFYEKVLKNLTERLFYRECNNYYEEYIENETPPPKFKMNSFWVNYQKQHEFNPLHFHARCLYSFVVFVKIPIHWEEQHTLPISSNSNHPYLNPCASDFQFVFTGKGNSFTGASGGNVISRNFKLSPEDEGRMLFFPTWLSHLVYPFYECEEERITISGNIAQVRGGERRPLDPGPLLDVEIEEKESVIKMLENSVQDIKDEVEKRKAELEKRKKQRDREI